MNLVKVNSKGIAKYVPLCVFDRLFHNFKIVNIKDEWIVTEYPCYPVVRN